MLVGILLQLYQAKYVDREALREVKNQVIARTKELKLALSARDEFLNKVHHEINTPMNGIINIASCMADFWPKLSDKDRRKYARTVSDSGNRLLKYTSHLIDLAKIRQKVYKINVTANIDLIKLAKKAVCDTDNWIISNNKNLAVKLEVIGDEKSIFIEADEEKISQVLDNLLNNAAKYSKKGEIILQIAAKKSCVEIAVIDQGVGIAEDEYMQIFTPFFEGSRTKSPAEGRGLGLSIAQKIVYLHHGCLRVKANYPTGSIFYFELPYKHVPAERSSNSLQGKVLVIDDNKNVRNNLGKLVTDLGYGVELAVNGQEALAYISVHHQDLDLVILNLDISENISGIVTLECLHDNLTYKTIPTLVYSQEDLDSEALKRFKAIVIDNPAEKNIVKSIKAYMAQYSKQELEND